MTHTPVALFLTIVLFCGVALAQDLTKAKQEEHIVFYTSWGPSDADYVIKAFEKKYPFLRVELARSSSEKTLNRLLTEQRANRFLGDVVAISGIQSGILKEKGALDRYQSKEAVNFPTEWRDPDGYGVGLHQTIYVGLVAVERTFFFQDSGLNSADGDYVAKKPVGSLFGQKTIQCFFAAAPRQFDS